MGWQAAITGALFAGSMVYRMLSRGKAQNTTEELQTEMNVNTSTYGLPIPIVYGTNRLSGNIIYFDDFAATSHTEVQGGGGGGKGFSAPKATRTYYTYSATFIIALCEGEIENVTAIWVNSDKTSGVPSGVVLGTVPQAVWPYLETYHPGKAIAYPGVAMYRKAAYDFGTTPSMPSFSFEIVGFYNNTTMNGANAASIVYDLLTNENYGETFNVANIGDLTDFSTYCTAEGFYINPIIDSQRAVQSIIAGILEVVNCDAIWSENKLKIIPLGDTMVAANGSTWQPNNTPLYYLTDSDYISENDAPIECERISKADAFNQVNVEYVDKNNNYNTETVEAYDLADIEERGVRVSATKDYHEINNSIMARKVAQLQLQKQLYRRNKYTFDLDWRYCLLEPLDIIAITDTRLGLLNQVVRIEEITETEEGLLTVVAEDFLEGIGYTIEYSTQSAERYSTSYVFGAGNINGPVIISPPLELTGDTPQLWIAVASTNQYWGGCELWVSTDDVTYEYVDILVGKSTIGYTVATLSAATNSPDTTNTLYIDLSESAVELDTSTEDNADNLRTLCLVGDQYLSYAYANLSTVIEYNYDLTYLVRGAYSSATDSIASGTTFVRLNNNLMKVDVTEDIVGKTIYAKFLAFNNVYRQKQSLDEVDPTIYDVPYYAGFLTYPVNLNVYNSTLTPDTILKITCDHMDLENDGGGVIDISDVNLSLVSSSPATNTWYNIFVCSNNITYNQSSIMSTATEPTLPSPYTHYRKVSEILVDGDGHFSYISQIDNEVLYDSNILCASGASLQNWVDVSLGNVIPPTSHRGWMLLQATASASDTVIAARKNGSSSTGQILGLAIAGTSGQTSGWVDADGSNIIEVYIQYDVSSWNLYCSGYKIAL